MAVAENGGTKILSSSQNVDDTVVNVGGNDVKGNSSQNSEEWLCEKVEGNGDEKPRDNVVGEGNDEVEKGNCVIGNNGERFKDEVRDLVLRNDVVDEGNDEVKKGNCVTGNGGERFKNEMTNLVEMLSKLNPMAQEFVPPSFVNNVHGFFVDNGYAYGYAANNFPVMQPNFAIANVNIGGKRRKYNNGQSKGRINSRTSTAQRQEIIRKTVYVSDIDQQVTEEQLAALFNGCGQVVDCRVCGDPNSVLRFAFIEFTDEEGARAALTLSGTVLGYYPVRVLPSKTAIAPVNPNYLPRSEDEREMCSRTVYCTNIDKKVTQADVKLFFESLCGEVHRLRLLGDYHHKTRIAFVEFAMAESAIAALNCSGAVLGTLPIRVSPSKTPVRPRIPRSPTH